MNSIVFPALGTGVGGFSLENCAIAMIDEVKKFDLTNPSFLKNVKFSLFSEDAFNEFIKHFKN